LSGCASGGHVHDAIRLAESPGSRIQAATDIRLLEESKCLKAILEGAVGWRWRVLEEATLVLGVSSDMQLCSTQLKVQLALSSHSWLSPTFSLVSPDGLGVKSLNNVIMKPLTSSC
jgi:hypothetical protein